MRSIVKFELEISGQMSGIFNRATLQRKYINRNRKRLDGIAAKDIKTVKNEQFLIFL